MTPPVKTSICMMAESKTKQLVFSLYFFLHMKYAYTGQKHRSFWVLAPGLPLFTGFQIQWDLDTRFCRQWDSGFLELFSGFQSPGFWYPLTRISPIPGSRFPYMGRVFAGYSSCLRYQHHGNRQECSLRKHPLLLALRRWGLFPRRNKFLRAKRPQRRRARRNGFFFAG